ncbi:putative 3-demethylubiquinone-9 3-methyltransferase (glyoxalase superfamily) [Mycoplana sp. BE70]|uniref:VOC family protein n=1 Tax=Mycoplana sp. BE70 TaxID=2817775 RepID=UPI00285B3D28|nr:VOC family protein [Mycoplana sp. BE70]MDR6757794.1 putative 3-demethylubiquinone-9 3-methyltransferase (glyoxalase superfamily) [Mycoplana sp. BE70]
MPMITPFLWFDDQLEDAMDFYASIFEDAAINTVKRGPDGKVFSASFRLAGQDFIGLNGGPHFTFNEAVSFLVLCEDQAEVDHHWDRLLQGGRPMQCGWLADRYGLVWQVVPKALLRLLDNPESAGRVHQTMMGMVKLDVAELERAAAA